MSIIVRGNTLSLGTQHMPCKVGRSGFVSPEAKKEGDGGTPTGTYTFTGLFYRADKLTLPSTNIASTPITPTMAWDDDAESPTYNQLITTPNPNHPERLWREDAVYDIILPLTYNMHPAIPHKGSAIFMHIWKNESSPTAGCVAVSLENMLLLLPHITPKTEITLHD